MPTETLIAPELAEDTSFNPSELEPPDGDQLLQEVSQFIGRYLHCSEHQRTIMALWALHTHSLPAAQVTPYLSIQAAEKQSGKSLCLQLLSLLCNSPALTTSFTAKTLTRRLDDKASTILFDECQAILGTRARSKGPVLRAILASGFHRGIGYTDSTHERNIFSPKAFAGMGQLPDALASRSIPIILQPLGGSLGILVRGERSELKSQEPTPPLSAAQAHNGDVSASSGAPASRGPLGRRKPGTGEKEVFPNNHAACNAVTHSQKIQRFNLRRASVEAKPLEERLSLWAEANLSILKEMPSYARQDFPSDLSPRRQDMIEPLLQLADFIGAEWPTRIREALAAAFEEEAAFELRLSLQLLADIRDCFAHHGFPNRLASATLLDWMHTRPARPWDVDGPITARTIARLLVPFEIHPRVQRIPGSPTARGYQLNDFRELWKTHFGFEVPPEPRPEDMFREFRAKMLEQSQLKIANKDAACNAVTHPDSISKISADQYQSAARVSDLSSVSPTSKSQEPKAGVFPQEELPEELKIPPQSVWQNGHNTVQPASL